MKTGGKDLFDTGHLSANLEKRSVRSGAVTLTAQGIMFLLQLGAMMVLARILTPADYGMMAMVVAITGFANIFIYLGLSTATIQKAEINHAQVSTLFWVNAGFGALVTLLVAAISPAVAWFYHEPALVGIMLTLSLNFLISSLAVQHNALLTRQMQFFTIAKIQVLAMLAGIVAAIIAALQGMGYWALVINSLVSTTFQAGGAWLALRWVPGMPRRNTGVLSLLKFGGDVVGYNVINYFSRNLDNILIGRYVGSASLGLYSKAYQLLMMPITNLRDPLNAVAMPALSRLQHEPAEFRKYHLELLSFLGFISMPLVAFLFVGSDRLISLVLGPQWMGASELFRILAFAAFMQTVGSTRGVVLLSTGNSRKYLVLGAVRAVFLCISFVAGLAWGVRGVAAAYVFANYLLLYPSIWYAFKNSPVQVSDFFRGIAKPLAASLTMAACGHFLMRYLTPLGDIAALALCLLGSVCVYIVMFIVVSGGTGVLRGYCLQARKIFTRDQS